MDLSPSFGSHPMTCITGIHNVPAACGHRKLGANFSMTARPGWFGGRPTPPWEWEDASTVAVAATNETAAIRNNIVIDITLFHGQLR